MAYTNFQNCTKQQYEQVIYGQNDKNKCKLYFNNVELPNADNYLEKITIIDRVLPENGQKIFSLDNFISKEVEIIIHNIDPSIIQDKVKIELGTKVGSNSLGDIWEYVPMGVFNIQDTPTRNDDRITIKLRDNAVLFDFNYNAKPLIDSSRVQTPDTTYLDEKYYYVYNESTSEYVLLVAGTDYQVGDTITGTIFEEKTDGQATLLQILQDMCRKANVNCNVSSFLGSTTAIGIYDNTIKARTYVSYIAEQAGCIAKIDRSGNLIFIPIDSLTTQRIPLSICSKYTKGTPFEIQRVVYELGTIKFETSNDENLQTLYISSLNPYIANQSQIETLFNTILDGFTIDSVELKDNILGNPSIDGYDLIQVYNDSDEEEPILFTTLSNHTLYYNGKFRNKYKTEIGLEARQENVTNTGDAVFQKTIKTEIDLLEGEVRTTVQEVKEYDTRITENENAINGTPTYAITTDTTFQEDKPYYKLVDDAYVELIEGTDYQDGDLISSVGYNVYDIIYVDSMMDTVNNSIQNQINDAIQIVQSTLLEQTSEKFTMWFEQTGLQKDIVDLKNAVGENSGNIEDIKAYISYGTVKQGEPYAGSPYIELGKENSQTKLMILENRIRFLTNGEETAYISNNQLYINENTVLTKQTIGNDNVGKWITDIDSNGNLNTYWGG